MPEIESATLLSKILEFSDAGERNINKQYIDIIISEEIPVLCVNLETGKKRLMPFKVLYDNSENFWKKEGMWKYYIRGEDLKKIKENAVSKQAAWELQRTQVISDKSNKIVPVILNKQEEPEELELEAEIGYGSDYEVIAKMNAKEKITRLFNQRQRLNELISSKTKDKKIVTETLIDAAKDVALINHSALEDAIILADDEAKKFTQEFVDSTHEMVKSSAMLIAEDVFSNELMDTLVKKSNGTIVQHMTRVFLNCISFLAFYNNLVTTSSAIQRLRISFEKKYRDFYHSLLPHMPREEVDLEHVFLGGMRAIPPDMFLKWAVGFLIHDIGKAAFIEYHEGEDAYDRSKVIEHIKTGYKSIMTKTNYPMEASLITGYHHEYYGDPDGYGYFRAYLQQYKRQNPSAKQDYVITLDLEPMVDYQALAYFPAKVLEIVDVYDSLTDTNRIYRKAMPPDEAIKMMRREFIVKRRKLDIILFDIFVVFIKEKYSIADIN